MAKRNPLAERVTWKEYRFMNGEVVWWGCEIGQWYVRLNRADSEFYVHAYWQPKVLEFQFSSGDLSGANVMRAAKREAIRLAQVAVLAAAAEWED